MLHKVDTAMVTTHQGTTIHTVQEAPQVVSQRQGKLNSINSVMQARQVYRHTCCVCVKEAWHIVVGSK